YDANNVQLSTKVDEIDSEDVAAKYRAWGWHVIEVDGNDVEQLRAALTEANAQTECPTLIIGHSIMAKGAMGANGESFEGKVSTHGQPLSGAGADLAATVKNLGGDPEDPFQLFAETAEIYEERRAELKAWAEAKKQEESAWRAENKELSRKLNRFLSGEVPEIDYNKIEVKPNTATRVASATMLGVYAEKVENMIVASADLSNSDKTDGFLKKTKEFQKGDFTGQFFQAGVAELTMACIMNGMALHGGVIPACGTFFVFSDYMKPAIRMSALMRLKVIYIWTHDSFRVGEDGPTHQPIEHEQQIRLMEQVHNHQGERSMVVLRPADAEETAVAWQYAMSEKRPVALILSRQNVNTLPALSCSRRDEAKQAMKGAYVVMDSAKAQVVMIASGSEVSTLIEGAEMLQKDGIAVRVVSVPSEGLFRDQPKSYQQSILLKDVPRYGLTSGLSMTLRGLVGEGGKIHGLDHFGYSAPYKVLDGKFGYNGQAVYEEVKAMLCKE
ncbi:MAG: transketolase, partial [Alistipes sp.]|nr:transketolase [Alistipes sp.]